MKTKFLMVASFFEFNCYGKISSDAEWFSLYACYVLENERLSDFYSYVYPFKGNATFEFVKLFKML
jgi:hypothetical protein